MIVSLTISGAGLLLYAAFLATVWPAGDASMDHDRPIGYRFVDDDDAPLPGDHLIAVDAWSYRTPAPVTVFVHYRVGIDGELARMTMERVGVSSTYVTTLPALAEGERYFYYLEIHDRAGNSVRLPEHAPDAPLYHVRFEGHVSSPVLALHITLMIGAIFFLVHAIHFSWLAGRGQRGQAAAVGLMKKAFRGISSGWLCFFIGGIPLGIYVSGSALGWHNAWGGWPLGTDITDTKTEVLVVYWGVLLLLRLDLLVGTTWSRARAVISDGATRAMILWGALLTAVVYAIPHSIFFQ